LDEEEEVPVLHPAAPARLATVRRPGRPRLQKERFTLTQVLELSAELLTMQLKLEVPTHSPSSRRRAAQARRHGREFGQVARDLRVRMEELCEAQAELEEVRGTELEGEAIRVRDEAERRFREAFLLLAG
jgi:hypothetical protein